VHKSNSVDKVFRVDLDAESNGGWFWFMGFSACFVVLNLEDVFVESLLDFADEHEPEEGVEDVDVVEHDEDGKAGDVVSALSIVLKRVVDDQSAHGRNTESDQSRFGTHGQEECAEHYSKDEHDGEHNDHVGLECSSLGGDLSGMDGISSG